MMRRKIQIYLDTIIVIMVALAWSRMLFTYDPAGRLTSTGLASLKYFTMLSNILMAVASAILMVWHLAHPVGRRIQDGEPAGYWTLMPRWMKRLCLTATAAVMVTFLVVVCFLGLLYGYRSMYRGANLYLHLLVPLLAFLNYVIFRRDTWLEFRDTLWAFLPVLIYGVFYLVNIAVNGRGEWPNTNDWYGFILWGWGIGLLFFVGIALIGWGIALLMWKLNKIFGQRG